MSNLKNIIDVSANSMVIDILPIELQSFNNRPAIKHRNCKNVVSAQKSFYVYISCSALLSDVTVVGCLNVFFYFRFEEMAHR